MVNNLLTILGAVGLTFIVTHSTLFKGVREFVAKKNLTAGKLISCPQCMGFWCGLFVYLVNIDIFTLCFIASFIALIVDKIIKKYL